MVIPQKNPSWQLEEYPDTHNKDGQKFFFLENQTGNLFCEPPEKKKKKSQPSRVIFQAENP